VKRWEHLWLFALLLTVLTMGFAAGQQCTEVFEQAVETGSREGITLPIIMYHSFLKDPARWGKYVIPPDQFEEDLVFLKEKGYEAITVSDLIAYVEHGTPLPDKPVMITIDDGYYNNYLYAYPILQKLGMKAVISPIAGCSDQYTQSGETNAYSSHIKWNEAAQMVASGLVELQNHSYDMHSHGDGRKGARRMKGESPEAYREVLEDDLTRAHRTISERTGQSPTAFTYPFGGISAESGEVVRKLGYKASFSCEEGINRITRDAECLYLLKRYNRPDQISTADFFQKIIE